MKRDLRPILFAVVFVFLACRPAQAAEGASCAYLLGQLDNDFGIELHANDQRYLKGMLNNVSPDGHPGAVIASTTRDAPNYYFNWIRDAGLTMNEIARLDQAADFAGQGAKYRQYLLDYVTFSRLNQSTANRSGGVDFGSGFAGLGEPKFFVDGSPFNGDWGRPQGDGPGFRAIALMKFAGTLLQDGDSEYVRANLYDGKWPGQTTSVIKKDLEFILKNWQGTSFDVWEEVEGRHFFTMMVQRRALIEGAAFANRMNDPGAAEAYEAAAKAMEPFIQSFWDSQKKIITVTRDFKRGLPSKTSGLDTAVILGSLYGSTAGFFSPSDDRVLATAFALEQKFREIYPINQPKDGSSPIAVLIGRYPEDVYDGGSNLGGNPWPLLTFEFAELCYRAADEFETSHSLTVTENNVDFLNSALSGAGNPSRLTPGMKLDGSTAQFHTVISALVAKGDGYIKRVEQFQDSNGELSEQIDRNTGAQRSAKSLTWNYVAYDRAVVARQILESKAAFGK